MSNTAKFEVNCGDNMTTFTGRYVRPWFMEPEHVDIQDIAQGLSNMCRFSGQCKSFYSVAQHSTLVAWSVWRFTADKKLALLGLLHDAPEAYASDLVRCVKSGLSEYKRLETILWRAVCAKFNMSFESIGGRLVLPPEVHEADMRMLVTERKYLISDKSAVWDLETKYQPYEFEIHSEEPRTAKKNFMFAFNTFSGDSII